MAAYPVWQATIVTEAGDIQPGSQIDVILESTGLAPVDGIWSDRAGTSALTNPFFADANGFAQFYAAPGEYRITATGIGGTRVWRYVVVLGIGDLIDAQAAAAGSASTALSAVTAAEAARDAAVVNSTVYSDEATGRAAVADGEYFKVIGDGDVAAYEYLRVDAVTSTLIVKFPSVKTLERARYQVLGSWTAIKSLGSHNFSVSNNRLYILADTGNLIPIEVQTDVVVNHNQCMYVDVETGPKSGINLIPQVGSLTASSPLLTTERVVLFSTQYSIHGGLVDRGILAVDAAYAATGPIAADIAKNKAAVEVGRYSIEGQWVYGNQDRAGTATPLVVVLDTLSIGRGADGTSVVTCPTGTHTIPVGGALVLNPDVSNIPYVVNLYTSEAENGVDAFVHDGKIALFIHTASNRVGGVLGSRQSVNDNWFGHVVVPDRDATISFDLATKTLTWDKDIYFYKKAGNFFSNRLRLRAGSYTFALNDKRVAYIDLRGLTNWGEATSADIKDGVYYSGTDRYVAESDQLPIFWYSNPNFGGIGGFDTTPIATTITNTAPVIIRVLPVVGGTDYEIHIHGRQRGSVTGKYVQWRFKRIPNPAINSDVWHISGAYEVDNTLLTVGRELLNSGENETAIREAGKADFVGGTAHGDEVTLWVNMQLDGNVIDPSVAGYHYGTTFRVQQKSQLYEENTAATVEWFRATKSWTFSNESVDIENRQVFQRDADITAFYNVFFCIARNEDGSNNATTAVFGAQAPEYTLVDMTLQSHDKSYVDSCPKAMAWGNGVQYTAEFLSGYEQQSVPLTTWSIATNKMYFQNLTAFYNKMYFQQGYTQILNGAITETKYRYTIEVA